MQPQPEAREEKKKEISSRNRAALEALLGPEKYVFFLSILYKSLVKVVRSYV